MTETLPEILQETIDIESLSGIQIVQLENQLINSIFDREGEITESVEETLKLTHEQIKQKIDSYFFALELLNSKAEFWKAQAEKCAAIKQKMIHNYERLEDRIRYIMSLANQKEFEGHITGFYISDKLFSIELKDGVNINQLPTWSLKIETKTVSSLDKSLVKQKILNGDSIDDLKPLINITPSLRKKLISPSTRKASKRIEGSGKIRGKSSLQK